MTATGDDLPMNCPSTLNLRQSSLVELGAPGARVEDLSIENVSVDPNDQLVARVQTNAQGRATVVVEAKAGTTPGQRFPNSKTPSFVVKETINGFTFDRPLYVIVSTIHAGGTSGKDTNPGTADLPFATFRQAIGVAQSGDTVELQDVSDTDRSPLTVPDGATVRSIESTLVTLAMPLSLAGSATLSGLYLPNGGLTIVKPGSQVVLQHVTNDHGLTIAKSATGAQVQIVGKSAFTNNETSPAVVPLLVQADGASVTINDPSTAISAGVQGANVEAIRLEGKNLHVSIGAGVRLEAFAASPAIHALGAVDLNVVGGRFINPVVLEDPQTTAAFQDSTVFQKAPLTMNGVSLVMKNVGATDSPVTFTGGSLQISDNSTFGNSPVIYQGSALQVADATFTNSSFVHTPATDGSQATAQIQTTAFSNTPVTFSSHSVSIMSGTSFMNSLMTFRGDKLDVTDAVFTGQGISQSCPGSTSKLTNVHITDYTDFGYQLAAGTVSILNSFFQHSSSVLATDPLKPPWALLIETPGDPEQSSVLSQDTSYDSMGQQTPCVAGPGAVAGLYYSMMTDATISFCGPN